MSDVSVIRPSGPDTAAQDLYNWGNFTLSDINSSQHDLNMDLSGTSANRQAAEAALLNSEATFFFGHGDWAELLNGGVAIIDKYNISKARNKIVVAIACNSAHALGDEAQKVGVRGYLGFEDEVSWFAGASEQRTRAACTAGTKELLSGRTLGDSADAMRSEFDDTVHYFKYGNGRSDPNSGLAFLWANWNKSKIRVKGQSNATL